MKPIVSIIVVSWNSRRFLEACLASVLSQTYSFIELIVVDNASTDGSADFVQERFPEAVLIRNGENEGFCAGNNAGLKKARGDYVFCLNPDAVLDEGYLEQALGAFSDDPRVGMVAGKILRFDRRTLDTTGQLFTRSRRVKERGYGQPDRGQYDTPGEVFSVCGAAALYRRAMVDDVSVEGEFFDEDFFAFGEDFDIGWRARNRGWRCLYRPRAVATHYRGGTQADVDAGPRRGGEMRRRPARIQAHIVKNRYLAMIKNERTGSFLRDLPFILAWDLVLWGYMLVFSPGAMAGIWKSRRLIGRAFEKRRALSKREPKGAMA